MDWICRCAGLLLPFLLAGCLGGEQEVTQRFFWPPPPVQPRIEYINFYMVEQDLHRGRTNWLAEFVLGKDRPVPMLKSPADIASDSKGRVLVSDLALKTVLVFDFNKPGVRNLMDKFGQPMFMQAPLGVTFDADGRAYVTDVSARKILVFNEAERLLMAIGNENLLHPAGVAVNSRAGRIYVADAWSHQIVVFDLDGNEVERWGKRGVEPGEYNYPVDIDIDADGLVYVLDAMNARVQVLDANGNFIRQFGERGTALGSFQIAKGLSVGGSGMVYVTDALSHKMVIFSKEGEFLLALGGRDVFSDGNVNPGGFYLPRGIDVDANDSIWVVDSLNNLFHRYQYLTEAYLQEHPIAPEQVYQPRSQSAPIGPR